MLGVELLEGTMARLFFLMPKLIVFGFGWAVVFYIYTKDFFVGLKYHKPFISCFPQKSILGTSKMAFLNIKNSVFCTIQFGIMLYGESKFIQKQISSKFLTEIKNVLNKDKPVIFYGIHTGNFFSILLDDSIIKALSGKEILLLAPKFKQKRKISLEKILTKSYGSKIKILGVEEKSVGIEIIKHVKNNGVILTILDFSNTYTRSEIMPFFNRLNPFPIGLIQFSLKYDIEIVGVYPKMSIIDTSFEIQKAICLYEKSLTPREGLSIIVRDIENYIQKNAESWMLWQGFYLSSMSSPLNFFK